MIYPLKARFDEVIIQKKKISFHLKNKNHFFKMK